MTESIADTTKPNAGRVYDYILGGHHNFEVDRMAAEQLTKLVPFAAKAARLQRWCLQDIAEELTVRRGFDVIIDFASGLPTQDHIHYVAPAGTTVIYSDHDPVTVAYAREILQDTPNVYYFQADARNPQDLLNLPEVQDILGGRRDIAFIHWGVSAFLTEDALTNIAQVLYEWAGEKSCWVFQAQGADFDPDNPALGMALKVYEQMKQPFYVRSLEQYQQLVSPWRPDDQGFISLLDWHGLDESQMTQEEREQFSTGAGYGAYLVK